MKEEGEYGRLSAICEQCQYDMNKAVPSICHLAFHFRKKALWLGDTMRNRQGEWKRDGGEGRGVE